MDDRMDDQEQRIREKAFQLWLEEGKPEGRHERHWELAKELVAMEDGRRDIAVPPAEAEAVGPAPAPEHAGDLPILTDFGEAEVAPPSDEGGGEGDAATDAAIADDPAADDLAADDPADIASAAAGEAPVAAVPGDGAPSLQPAPPQAGPETAVVDAVVAEQVPAAGADGPEPRAEGPQERRGSIWRFLGLGWGRGK
jgi:hypothetical protein